MREIKILQIKCLNVKIALFEKKINLKIIFDIGRAKNCKKYPKISEKFLIFISGSKKNCFYILLYYCITVVYNQNSLLGRNIKIFELRRNDLLSKLKHSIPNSKFTIIKIFSENSIKIHELYNKTWIKQNQKSKLF